MVSFNTKLTCSSQLSTSLYQNRTPTRTKNIMHFSQTHSSQDSLFKQAQKIMSQEELLSCYRELTLTTLPNSAGAHNKAVHALLSLLHFNSSSSSYHFHCSAGRAHRDGTKVHGHWPRAINLVSESLFFQKLFKLKVFWRLYIVKSLTQKSCL